MRHLVSWRTGEGTYRWNIVVIVRHKWKHLCCNKYIYFIWQILHFFRMVFSRVSNMNDFFQLWLCCCCTTWSRYQSQFSLLMWNFLNNTYFSKSWNFNGYNLAVCHLLMDLRNTDKIGLFLSEGKMHVVTTNILSLFQKKVLTVDTLMHLKLYLVPAVFSYQIKYQQ